MIERRWLCFNYGGLLLACMASFCTSLLFSLEDDHLTLVEAARAFLHVAISGVAYTQNPFCRRRLFRRLPEQRKPQRLERKDSDDETN